MLCVVYRLNYADMTYLSNYVLCFIFRGPRVPAGRAPFRLFLCPLNSICLIDCFISYNFLLLNIYFALYVFPAGRAPEADGTYLDHSHSII